MSLQKIPEKSRNGILAKYYVESKNSGQTAVPKSEYSTKLNMKLSNETVSKIMLWAVNEENGIVLTSPPRTISLFGNSKFIVWKISAVTFIV